MLRYIVILFFPFLFLNFVEHFYCGRNVCRTFHFNEGPKLTVISFYYINCSCLLIFTPLIKSIISYVWLSMIISHVSIIMKRIGVYCGYICHVIGLFFYIINRAIYAMFGNMKLFLVLTRISHSFTLLTREISWSTLEIYFIFPHIHVLFSTSIFRHFTNLIVTKLPR